MNKYGAWLDLKEGIKHLTEKLHAIEAEIWLEAEAAGNLNPKGGKTFEAGEYKVTINHVDSVKVDQKLAAERPELFRLKYEYDKSQYKNLVVSQRSYVDDAITISPNKPSFKVVKVESVNQ
jgi:hypothetical protein